MIEICFDESLRCAAEWAQLAVPEAPAPGRDWHDIINLVIQFAVAVGTIGATYFAFRATRFQLGPTLALRASTIQQREWFHAKDRGLMSQMMPAVHLRVDNIGSREVKLAGIELTLVGFPKIAAKYAGNIFDSDQQNFFFPKILMCQSECAITISTAALCQNFQIMQDDWADLATHLPCRLALSMVRLRVRLSTGHAFQTVLPKAVHDLAWQALLRRKGGLLDWPG